MNPLEYLDVIETKQIDKINLGPEQYTKEEVMQLVRDIGLQYRKAIYNGEYIMDIETLSKQNIEIADKEFSIQKLITHDNKYLLFIQITNILDETFAETDMEIMMEEINKAIKKTNNIAGVIILPPEMEISLITAKLETISYANKLGITEKEQQVLNELHNNLRKSIDDYVKSPTTAQGLNLSPEANKTAKEVFKMLYDTKLYSDTYRG